jgi:hypothetical protein
MGCGARKLVPMRSYADEVDVNLDVLCATMVNMFAGHINNIDIVCRAQRRS